MARALVAALALLSACQCTGTDTDTVSFEEQIAEANANPIRRVVTMLQKMVKKVQAEGEKEKELYDKFMCYCKNGGGELQQSIAESTARVPQTQSAIEEAEARVKQLNQDLKSHQEDRSAAKSAIEQATTQRENEHKKFVEESDEQKTYLSALGKAIPAIEKGMSGGFLQSGIASQAKQLRQAVSEDNSMAEYDRQLVMSFLSGATSTSDGYAPKSGEIVGILKGIQDDFEKSLADLESDEAGAKKLYDELVRAKNREVQALTDSIEKKSARLGELQVEIVNMKNDLTETEAALVEDQKFLANLESDCKAKSGEWEERTKLRNEELVALHDTIKILNDDDALELFKKTLPSASFLQTGAGAKQRAKKAIDFIRTAQRPTWSGKPGLDFIAMALTGRKVDFSKVIKMIDDMVALLATEQADDDSKKEYCELQLDQTEDKVKALSKKIDDYKASIADKTDSAKTLAAEIKQLTQGIADLDKQVTDATAMRKQQHEEFQELIASDSAAKELLNMAKNRLNKFYNKKLYKTTPAPEVSREEEIAQNFGAAFVEVSRHRQHQRDEPAPAPDTWEGGLEKKSEESNGVIAMIDLLAADLDKEMAEAKVEEKNAQEAYEEMMNDAAAKRAADLKTIATKEDARTDAEVGRNHDQESLNAKSKELQATNMYEMQLHQECDWLISNFDIRKQARAEESDSLKNAKAILSGADFSLVQKSGRAPSVARQL